MGRGRRLGRRLERAMDFPGGTLTGTAILEVEGGRRVVVSGCCGIHAYSTDRICLCTPEGKVAFYGQGLEMGCLSEEGAIIEGSLQRIEFTE